MTRPLIITVLSLLSLCASFQAGAQANRYHLQRATEPYTELTGDTTLSAGNFGMGNLKVFPLSGDTFQFFNRDFRINGSTTYIAFGDDGHFHIEDRTRYFIIDGLFYWLDSISPASSISYKIEGAGPNKILKAQWKDLKVRSGPDGNFINFQIWLYKANGMVELRYGPRSANNADAYGDQTGPNVGIFYSNKNFSVMYEKIWVNGLHGENRIDSARNMVFNGMHGIPPDSTVYRFAVKPSLTATEGPRAEEGMVSIGPNPATDKAVIHLKTSHPATLTLTDLQGRAVYHTTTNDRVFSLPVAALQAGLYLLAVQSNGRTAVQRIVVQH